MGTEQQDILRAKVNMETSRIEWKELQKFFAGGLAVKISHKLDMIEVALQMHEDNKPQFEKWLSAGLVGKVSDEQAALWLAANTEVWAVVVSPWVLVQEIDKSTEH